MSSRPPTAAGASPENDLMTVAHVVQFLRNSFSSADFEKAERILTAREQHLIADLERKFLADLELKDVEKIELEAQIHGLLRELGPLRSRCSELELKIKKAEGELAVRKAVLDRKCERVSMLEKRVGELDDRNIELEAEIEGYRKGLESIERRVEGFVGEFRVFGEVGDGGLWVRKCEALECDVMVKNERISMLEAKVRKLDERRGFLEANCRDLDGCRFSSGEGERANGDVEFWRKKCEELDSRVKGLEQENLQLRGAAVKVEEGGGNDVGFVVSEVEPKGDEKECGNGVIEITDSDDETGSVCERKEETVTKGGFVLTKESTTGEVVKVKHFGKCGWIDDLGVSCDNHQESLVTNPTPKRKRGTRVISSDSEAEDEEDGDDVPLSQLKLRWFEKGRENNLLDHTAEAEDIAPSRRRLVSLKEICKPDPLAECISPRHPCTPSASSRLRSAARKKLVYPVSEDDEEENIVNEGQVAQEDDDSESEGESLGGFIVNTSDSSQSESESEDSSSSSSSEEVESFNLSDVVANIRREKHTSKWEYEADMLSSFARDPELCMKAVCALYRQQTSEEKSCKASILYNKRGFNKFDAVRGSKIAEFLMDGDPHGPLKKSVKELQKYDQGGINFCHELANRYSKQLFAIYQNKEDPYFSHPE